MANLDQSLSPEKPVKRSVWPVYVGKTISKTGSFVPIRVSVRRLQEIGADMFLDIHATGFSGRIIDVYTLPRGVIQSPPDRHDGRPITVGAARPRDFRGKPDFHGGRPQLGMGCLADIPSVPSKPWRFVLCPNLSQYIWLNISVSPVNNPCEINDFPS